MRLVFTIFSDAILKVNENCLYITKTQLVIADGPALTGDRYQIDSFNLIVYLTVQESLSAPIFLPIYGLSLSNLSLFILFPSIFTSVLQKDHK